MKINLKKFTEYLKNFIKIILFLIICDNCNAFKAALFDKEYSYPEHSSYKGYARNAIDQLKILSDLQQLQLDSQYKKNGKFSWKEIESTSSTIAKLITMGIYENGNNAVIDYGISNVLANKQQAQMMTKGINLFARLCTDPEKDWKGFTSTKSSKHFQTSQSIFNLARSIALPYEIEKAMWLPPTSWEKSGSGRAAKNSSNTLGGTCRKEIMKQTRKVIESGYIAEDGMIVLPSISYPLADLPNTIIEDLYPSKSNFYGNGIEKLSGKRSNYSTIFKTLEGDSIEIALKLRRKIGDDKKIAILNMANTHTPGGGARNHGSRAQEEQLCYRSNLLPTLEVHENQGAYKFSLGISREINKSTNSDAGIFSPDIIFFRTFIENGSIPHYGFKSELEHFGIISSAAVDLRKQKEKPRDYKYINLAKIQFQLRAALNNGFKNIVLGAFGCGAFKNNPADIAAFYEKIFQEDEFKGNFESIYFGIMINDEKDKENFNKFKDMTKKMVDNKPPSWFDKR